MYLEMACVRLMPSYNGILTISCIRTLTQIGLKLSGFIPLVSVFVVFHIPFLKFIFQCFCYYFLSNNGLFLGLLSFLSCVWYLRQDRVIELVKPFRDFQAIWQVRIEASRALLGLEFHFKGIDAALSLFIKYVEEEPSIRGF